MGLFNKVKSFFSTRKSSTQHTSVQAPQPRYEVSFFAQPDAHGHLVVSFSKVLGEDSTLVELPLTFEHGVERSTKFTQAALAVKQLLSISDEIQPDAEKKYAIPYDLLRNADGTTLTMLGIEPADGWQMRIRSRGVIGKQSHIELDWLQDGVTQERYMEVACGLYDKSTGQLFFINKNELRIRDAARALRQPKSSQEEEFRALAALNDAVDVYEKTRQADGITDSRVTVDLDAQLRREIYKAPKKAKIKVNSNEDGGLDLTPVVEGVDDEQLATSDPIRQLFFHKNSDGITERTVLPEETLRVVNQVKAHAHVPREKRADFERDPRAYLQPPTSTENLDDDIYLTGGEEEEEEDILDLSDLPEQLDRLPVLEDYGDRVHEISTQAYENHQEKNNSIDLGGVIPDELVDDEFEHQEEEETQNDSDELEQGSVQGQVTLKTRDNIEEIEYEQKQRALLRKQFSSLVLPECLTATLYSHQEEGYAWLRTLYDQSARDESIGGLLADDMGLGKTVQLISLVCHMREHNELGPSLLVVPKIVVPNWQDELGKFCSARLIVQEHLGSHRTGSIKKLERADIIITTYDTLVRDQLLLGRLELNMLVLDEAQYIKNYTTKRASAARAMNTRFRIALTATPVENNLKELWAIMDFAQPSILGTLREFRKDFAKPLEEAAAKGDAASLREAHRITERIADHYLRRTKQQALTNLTKKEIHRIELPLTNVQQDMYRKVANHYKHTTGPLPAIRPMLNTCTHPYAMDDETLASMGVLTHVTHVMEDNSLLIDSSNKFTWLLSQLGEIKTLNEKVIIFSSIKLIQTLLQVFVAEKFDLDAPIINGEVSANARHRIIKKFNESSGFRVIILSAQAAGVGVNVTGANHVIHMTREWNPAKENQATDRAYRIGQKKDVHVYLPISTCSNFLTLDMKVDKLLKAKQSLATNVIVPSKNNGIQLKELEECMNEVIS